MEIRFFKTIDEWAISDEYVVIASVATYLISTIKFPGLKDDFSYGVGMYSRIELLVARGITSVSIVGLRYLVNIISIYLFLPSDC
jgi:hypothetical protein